MEKPKKSSTQQRQMIYYPTPQMQAKLERYVFDENGDKRDGRTKNKTINDAMKHFFASIVL